MAPADLPRRLLARRLLVLGAALPFGAVRRAPARAAESALWRLPLPPGFEVQRRLKTFAPAANGAPILALFALERETGIEARLTCVPFGTGASGSGLSAAAQAALVAALVDKPARAGAAAVADAFASALDAQVADPALPLLARGPLALLADATRGAAPTDDGALSATRRYVTLRYTASACPARAWADGGCEWQGAALARAHTVVLAAGALGRARTLSEAEAEGGGGGGLVSALFILNLSALESASERPVVAAAAEGGESERALRARLEQIAASFDVLD